MNEQLKLLVELQEIDTAILSLTDEIEAIPQKLNKYRVPLQEAHDAFQQIKAKSETLKKKKKDKDLQLDEMQGKIDKMRARSSEIKTNKEYEAHLKEIEGFEKKRYAIEDEILVLMEDIENFSVDVIKREEEKLKKAEEEFRQQEKIFKEEKNRLEAALEKEKARKDDFVSRIDEGYFHQYTNLLNKFGDKAVVETKNEICFGCNTNIPPQLFNDIKKNEDIYTCFYCKRFLYYKEALSPGSESQDNAPAS